MFKTRVYITQLMRCENAARLAAEGAMLLAGVLTVD